MGKMKRACVTCGLLYFKGYPMSKHRRMCHKGDEDQDDEDSDDAEEDDDEEQDDDDEDQGAEEDHDVEEEDEFCDGESSGSYESNGSDEDVGDNVNPQRRLRLLMYIIYTFMCVINIH